VNEEEEVHSTQLLLFTQVRCPTDGRMERPFAIVWQRYEENIDHAVCWYKLLNKLPSIA